MGFVFETGVVLEFLLEELFLLGVQVDGSEATELLPLGLLGLVLHGAVVVHGVVHHRRIGRWLGLFLLGGQWETRFLFVVLGLPGCLESGRLFDMAADASGYSEVALLLLALALGRFLASLVATVLFALQMRLLGLLLDGVQQHQGAVVFGRSVDLELGGPGFRAGECLAHGGACFLRDRLLVKLEVGDYVAADCLGEDVLLEDVELGELAIAVLVVNIVIVSELLYV